MPHGLWRIAALCCRLATLRFGWFAACSGASAHCVPRGSGKGIVAGRISALEVAGPGVGSGSPDSPPMSALGQKRTLQWSAPLMVDRFRRRF